MTITGAVVLGALGGLVTSTAAATHKPMEASAIATLAEQEASAVEAGLGLDRPTRRLLQERLHEEGFDPGVVDGLFGPRTRAAIRRWQAARGLAATGYLDSAHVALLRTEADSPPPASAEPLAVAPNVGPAVVDELQSPADEPSTEPVVPARVAPSPTAAAEGPRCEAWNTGEFFEATTASEVAACLAAGADLAARDDERRTPLHRAAWASDDPMVIEALLAAGADLHARDDGGETPLHWAASTTNEKVVEALVVAGAALEARRRRDDTTPLQVAAAFSDNPATVEILLAAGADSEVQTEDDRTLLHLAARYNENPAVAEVLLAAGADLTARDGDDFTALHLAATHNGNPAVLETLVAAGGDVTARIARLGRYNGWTPLHAAAWNGRLAAVTILLGAAADPDAVADARTPVDLAIYGDHAAVFEALLAGGAHPDGPPDALSPPLNVAAGTRRVAAVDLLLAAGANANGTGPNPAESPLWSAVRGGSLQIVTALLRAGADPRAVDRYGRTPLHNAGGGPGPDELAVVEVLLAAGADARAVDSVGRTPLHHAAAYADDPAVIEALLAAGADLEATGLPSGAIGWDDEQERARLGYDRPRTPLFEAARNDNPDVMRALLAAGANLQAARLSDGTTVLHEAAGGNENLAAVIDVLLSAGANLDSRDGRGRTALHHAANHWRALSELTALLNAGANVDARDEDGNTPLHLAAAFIDHLGLNERHLGDAIEALLDGGANPHLRNAAGQTAWDLAQENEELRGSDGYWRLNDARFDTPPRESRRPSPGRTPPASERGPHPRADAVPASPPRQARACEIAGYPTPANVQGLGLSWCGPSVGLQRRAFALQAAGAWCDIEIGSSSTAEQVAARHGEIDAACDRLDAMQASGIPPCQCPVGYRP